MRDFLVVFKFEFINQMKKKAVIVTTAILMVVAFALASIPTIMKWFDSKPVVSETETEEPTVIEKAGYYFINNDDKELLSTILNIDSNDIYASKETLEAEIMKEQSTYNVGFVINSSTDFTSIYKDRSIFSTEGAMLSEVLKQMVINQRLQEYNLSIEDYNQLQQVNITENTEILGRDGSSNMFMAYAMIIITFLIINLYGTNTAVNIAREKDSRTMELLITSVKPSSLIIGKVAAMGLAALVQIGLIVAMGIIGYQLSKQNYPEMLLMMIHSSITVDAMLIYLIYFLLGYTLYLFIYASMGSVVSKVEDVNSAVAPLTFIFMLGYFLSFMTMTMPNDTLAKVGSLIPFTSLLVMPTRYPLISVPPLELILSIGLLVVSAVFFAYISIKIYRMGSLNYGNKIGFFKAIKMALTKEQ